jgi:hypothetical protein
MLPYLPANVIGLREAMAEAKTTKCPLCGFENDPTARKCASPSCGSDLRSEIERVRSIEASIGKSKRSAIWWLILLILVVVVSLIIHRMPR